MYKKQLHCNVIWGIFSLRNCDWFTCFLCVADKFGRRHDVAIFTVECRTVDNVTNTRPNYDCRNVRRLCSIIIDQLNKLRFFHFQIILIAISCWDTNTHKIHLLSQSNISWLINKIRQNHKFSSAMNLFLWRFARLPISDGCSTTIIMEIWQKLRKCENHIHCTYADACTSWANGVPFDVNETWQVWQVSPTFHVLPVASKVWREHYKTERKSETALCVL